MEEDWNEAANVFCASIMEIHLITKLNIQRQIIFPPIDSAHPYGLSENRHFPLSMTHLLLTLMSRCGGAGYTNVMCSNTNYESLHFNSAFTSQCVDQHVALEKQMLHNAS